MPTPPGRIAEHGRPGTRCLNDGLVQFKDELAADALALQRVEIGIVTFGPVETPLVTKH